MVVDGVGQNTPLCSDSDLGSAGLEILVLANRNWSVDLSWDLCVSVDSHRKLHVTRSVTAKYWSDLRTNSAVDHDFSIVTLTHYS